MRRVLSLAVTSLLLLGVFSYSNPIANAQYGEQQTTTNDEFRVVFHHPESQELQQYYSLVKNESNLEKDAKNFSNLFMFPAQHSHIVVWIHLGECGSSTAYYNPAKKAVVICYELVKDIMNLSKVVKAFHPNIDPKQATLDTTRGILYHELGHALVNIFDLDVLGKEEDAVDTFATLMLISNKEYNPIIHAGILAYYWGQVESVIGLQFWDEHSFTLQRMYNVVCLLYGSNPEEFKSLSGSILLDEKRAPRCSSEYNQAKKSWENQLSPFIANIEKHVSKFTVETGKTSYSSDEAVGVGGKVTAVIQNEKVTIKTYNPNMVLVASQQATVFENGAYLTTVILGGAYGVDSKLLISGVYTVEASYAGSSAQTTFTYKSQTTQPSPPQTELKPFLIGPYTDKAEYTVGEYVTVTGVVVFCSDHGNTITLKFHNPKNQVFHAKTVVLDECKFTYSTQLTGDLALAGLWRVIGEFNNISAEWSFILKGVTKPEPKPAPSPQPTPQPAIAPEKPTSVKVIAKQVKDLLLIRVTGLGIDQFDIMNYSSAPFIDACRAKEWTVVTCDPNIAKFTAISILDGKAIFKIKLSSGVNSFNWFAYTDGEKIDSGNTSVIRR